MLDNLKHALCIYYEKQTRKMRENSDWKSYHENSSKHCVIKLAIATLKFCLKGLNMGLPERINLRDKSILDLSISMSKKKKKIKRDKRGRKYYDYKEKI